MRLCGSIWEPKSQRPSREDKRQSDGNSCFHSRGRSGLPRRALLLRIPLLVHRVISRRHTVGFKRVWMRGVSEAHPACAGRNERTTMQTDPFRANTLGRGQLADFLSGSRRTHSSRPTLVLRWRHWTQIGRSAKLVRDARRNRQSGSDRLENQPTDRRRYASYL